ncbi:ras-related protein Rab-44-like [Rhinophrynus dorsalis]
MAEQKKARGRKLGSSRRRMMEKNDTEEIKTETVIQPAEEASFFSEVTEKIRNLLCNKEDAHSSVFITRNDMEKVSSIIFCNVEELEFLFDQLNCEGKGYLTYEEFTSGLRDFINSDKSQWNQKRKRKSTRRIAEFSKLPSLEEADDEERKQFKSFMEHLGANNIFEDETEIWKLWTRLGHDEPHLLGNLEEFLAKVTSQIKEARQEKETLEMVLKKRISEHNEEVQHLYEEMEQQINAERKRMLNESHARSSIHSKEMKKVIDIKNKDVQQLVAVQDELERELHNLRSTQQVTKTENEQLKRTNQDLELHLEKIRHQLSEAQIHLSDMKRKVIQRDSESDKKDLDDSMNLSSPQDPSQKDKHSDTEETESEPINQYKSPQLSPTNIYSSPDTDSSLRTRVISIEEDPLPDYLITDHDLPETDIADMRPLDSIQPLGEEEDSIPQDMTQEIREYIHFKQNKFNPFDTIPDVASDPTETLSRTSEIKDGFHANSPYQISFSDHIDIDYSNTLHPTASLETLPLSHQDSKNCDTLESDTLAQEILKNEMNQVNNIYMDPDMSSERNVSKAKLEVAGKPPDLVTHIKVNGKTDSTQKNLDEQGLHTNPSTVQSPDAIGSKGSYQDTSGPPDHVYKILFVGNTNVGKTSFLHRVHEGTYQRNTSATIGIDYRIKTIIVDNKRFALQLWDTAGQERFHSITENFFRKADGIVIMYDVTLKNTFTAVRYWLNNIREKIENDIVILLVGNKIDQDSERNVSTAEGEKLAQEYKLLFTECSAASGINVLEPLTAIARVYKIHYHNEADIESRGEVEQGPASPTIELLEDTSSTPSSAEPLQHDNSIEQTATQPLKDTNAMLDAT